MTYEEFKQQTADLEQKISKLRSDYITEHAKYKKGDRLKLMDNGKETIAEVYGNDLYYDGSVTPLCRKVKKDGSVSSTRAYIWSYTSIETL